MSKPLLSKVQIERAKVIRIGSSLGLILPSHLVKVFDVSKDDFISVVIRRID